jgi:hypothetical protein
MNCGEAIDVGTEYLRWMSVDDGKAHTNVMHQECLDDLNEAYGSGGEVTHTIELYRTNRVDCYRVVADGGEWKRRLGWAKVLEAIRKNFIRVASPRNS